MKVAKLVGSILLSFLCVGIIILFEIKMWPAGSSLAGVALGLLLPAMWRSVEDITDNSDWKENQRKLKRGGLLKDDTIIRVSLAYLYRIKIGNKYMLVQNSRNTGKYQPVGGVYKMYADEKMVLKNLLHVMDDDKIPIDESSKDDYRLRLESKYLRRFMSRFDNAEAARERINNIGREFKEELVDTGIINWSEIKYRCCGRDIAGVKYGEKIQVFELLLADVVELIPTQEQENDLRKLLESSSKQYKFATAKQISSLGIDYESGQLYEWIGDQTKNVIEENETKLLETDYVGKIFTVQLQ